MSVLENNAQAKPAPPVEHAAWSVPDLHVYVGGGLDQWCRGEMAFTEGMTTCPPADPNDVAVFLSRYSVWSASSWRRDEVGVVLRPSRECGADLTPAEAREVARNLLNAGDVAERMAG